MIQIFPNCGKMFIVLDFRQSLLGLSMRSRSMLKLPDTGDFKAPPPRRGRPARRSPVKAGHTTVLIGLDLLKHIAVARRPLALSGIEVRRCRGLLVATQDKHQASVH